MFNPPVVQDFKNQFSRDFPYGLDPNTSVLDSDITYAFQFVNASINQGFFSDQGTYTVGYNLLAAHYLVTNLRASSQGINGQYNWLQNSKGVGQVNEAFGIPDRILQNPYFSALSKTNYGNAFLMLIMPQLTAMAYGVWAPSQAL